MDYQEALSWIHSIGRFGMNQGLERIKALLEELDNPHEKLNFLHIGGTNGKGSTAAIAASVLEAAGYKVGLYTSPYLIQFTNRMSINGEDIPQERLVKLVERVKPVVEKISATPSLGQPTEFEVVTAIALTYFAQEKPDVVVLEVGLGGRLDATNVVHPLVTALTTISLDHTQVLGNTVEEITREKVGIIKTGAPVVTQASGTSLDIIQWTCRQKDVSLFSWEKDFFVDTVNKSLTGQEFNYSGIGEKYDKLFISLLGEHQVKNAALALAALEILKDKGFYVPEESLRQGLAATNWPGRIEVMGYSPLVVIDGAHNLEAFQGLRKVIEEIFPYQRLILVLGILSDKAVDNIIGEIVPQADILLITKPNNPRAAAPGELKKIAADLTSAEIICEEKIPEAVDTALSLAGEDDLVLFAGSLYLISEVRGYLKNSKALDFKVN